jgi:UDP-N-acetylmuramate dehydrogenase
MDENLQRELLKILDENRARRNEPMSKHTTFGIGGPADVYFESSSPEEIRKAIDACKRFGIPYLVLGVGANILVSDKGIRGLVVKPSDGSMVVVGPLVGASLVNYPARSKVHYQQFDTKKYLKFDDLDLEESVPDTLIKVGAGTSLPVLITWSLDHGLTGLQSFAGIPASIGGAVYNNIHGGTKLFDQFVHEVVLINSEEKIVTIPNNEMEFSYDVSRLQRTKEVVLEVVLKLSRGNIEQARWVREEWLKRKLKVQPQSRCPGCIFKNMSPQEAKRIGSPTVSSAWVLDVGLGLKGTRVGGVSISQSHANFFVNDGNGKASEVMELINLCKTKAKEKFGLDLIEEIQVVGEF